MKKLLTLIFTLALTCNIAKADFAKHYNDAQNYLSQYQYSSAISEFKKALRINYLDNSARIGLINSYLARGTYYANKDKNWDAAADDYRAALFYLRYYPDDKEVQNSIQSISNTSSNLDKCLSVLKFDTSAKSRYEKAKRLRYNGLFAAAGYEFAQTFLDPNYRKDSYEQVADIMKVLGNNQKSADYYEKAVAMNPDDACLRLKYARVLDRLGENDKAVNEYNYALANGGSDPEVLYALERMYRQKLMKSPNDAATITNLGAILQKQNKYDEALKYYSQANQLDPSSVTTRLNVGTLYQQKKSYDSAIEAYNSILFLYPDNIQANLFKAQCLAAKGNMNQATALFNKVLKIDPDNKQTKTEIFETLKTTMSPAQMISYFKMHSVLNEDTINDIYNYAIDLHKKKQLNNAIAYYNEILTVKTDNPEIYINLAIAYDESNKKERAKEILITAKNKFPKNTQIAQNLKALQEEAVAGKFSDALKLYNSGDYQKAIGVYNTIQPPSVDSLTGIAACYKELGDNVQAIQYYKKSLQLKPDSDISYYIGVIYSETENWDNAKTYLKKAIALNSNNEKAKDLLDSVIQQANIELVDKAIALYDKAEYTKSLALINNILKEEPENSYALYYRALINDINKKYNAAIQDYQKAIKYNSELTIIYYLMALDYDNLGQYKLALANYKKYVSLTAENNEYKKYSQSRIKTIK